jgi:pilus assembly protein Flp/PilA
MFMSNILKSLVAGEEGATMVEYALMVALIGAALVAAVSSLGDAISGQFSSVSNSVSGTGS